MKTYFMIGGHVSTKVAPKVKMIVRQYSADIYH